MNMHKIIILSTAFVMLVAMTACNKGSGNANNSTEETISIYTGTGGNSGNNIVSEYNNLDDPDILEYGAYDYDNRGDLRYELEHANPDGSIDGVIKDTSLEDYGHKAYDINNDITEKYSSISGVWQSDTDNKEFQFYSNNGFKYDIFFMNCLDYEISEEEHRITITKAEGKQLEYKIGELLRMDNSIMAYSCIDDTDKDNILNYVILEDTEENECYVIYPQGVAYSVTDNRVDYYIGTWNSSYATIDLSEDSSKLKLTEYDIDNDAHIDEHEYSRYTKFDTILNLG